MPATGGGKAGIIPGDSMITAARRPLRLRQVMRATTILRYLDNQGRPDHQTGACDTHASELCAELRVIDRRRRSV